MAGLVHGLRVPVETRWTIAAKSAPRATASPSRRRSSPAIPVTVQQATLAQLERTFTLPVAAPADALADASGGTCAAACRSALKPKLSDGLPGVIDWFNRYPYDCLEQQASIAIGTLDETRWDDVARRIPLYLDSDGLAAYYPPRADDPASGSDVLTAYLLTASAEASAFGRYAIPDATRAKMQAGLVGVRRGSHQARACGRRSRATRNVSSTCASSPRSMR